MKKITLFAALMAMAVMPFTACSSSNGENAANDEENTEATVVDVVDEAAETATGVISLTDDEQFRPETMVDEVTVLDFNATWCVPCKKLTPAYDKAAESMDNVKFYSVDIDVNTATKEAFNITGVPTVIILSPNGTAQRFEGLDPFIVGYPEDILKDKDALTEAIYTNLVKAIDQASK